MVCHDNHDEHEVYVCSQSLSVCCVPTTCRVDTPEPGNGSKLTFPQSSQRD